MVKCLQQVLFKFWKKMQTVNLFKSTKRVGAKQTISDAFSEILLFVLSKIKFFCYTLQEG